MVTGEIDSEYMDVALTYKKNHVELLRSNYGNLQGCGAFANQYLFKSMSRLIYISSILFSAFVSCNGSKSLEMKHTVRLESLFLENAPKIPGKIQCEFYNLGGEGIGYHDSDATNHGSGNLNKGIDYLSTFRQAEAPDISFTKYHDSIDNSKYNKVLPKEGQLYLGWTEPGEWTKYTVTVKKSGTYQIGLMYTANQNGQISIASEDKKSSGILNVESTFDKDDPIAWRQWHHWNYVENLGQIRLKKGTQTITLHTESVGQMNYDFIEFTRIKQ